MMSNLEQRGCSRQQRLIKVKVNKVNLPKLLASAQGLAARVKEDKKHKNIFIYYIN